MHELSIAMSIIDVAMEEARRLDAIILVIHLRLGPLSGVAREALISAYGLACEGTPLAGSRLKVQEMPIVAWCPTCAGEKQIPSPQRICCPTCDTPTPRIVSGQELEIVGLEILNEAIDPHNRSTQAGAQA